jgi:glycosyltransferase involved in cell wall biosynthesis
VTLVTFQGAGNKPFFELDPRVSLHQIAAVNRTRNLVEITRTNAARIRRLRTLFIELAPEVIVAFMTEANIIALCASRGLGIPTIVSERNQPERPGLGRLRRMVRNLCYRWCTALVVQTDEISAWAANQFGIPVHVIRNPVLLDREDARRGGEEPHTEYEIVAAGRLVPQKGFDLLIESFAQVASGYPAWNLTIYGEGPDRVALESTIRHRGLIGRVTLPGLCNDMRAAFRQASLFVLPSRFEGYPNVLLEALASGCPVIAADCPGGCKEILDQGRFGVLVPSEDVACLAAALQAMMQSPIEREYYAVRAPGAVRELNVDAIAQRWIDLFCQFQFSASDVACRSRSPSSSAFC